MSILRTALNGNQTFQNHLRGDYGKQLRIRIDCVRLSGSRFVLQDVVFADVRIAETLFLNAELFQIIHQPEKQPVKNFRHEAVYQAVVRGTHLRDDNAREKEKTFGKEIHGGVVCVHKKIGVEQKPGPWEFLIILN